MTDIEQYLKMLKSKNTSEKLAACERLYAMPKLSLRGVNALLRSTRDSNSEVADAARRALQVHMNSSEQEAPSLSMPFWEDEGRKFGAIVLLFVAEFMLTLQVSPAVIIMPPVLLLFPIGLLFWIPQDTSSTWVRLYIGLGWLLYIGLVTSILLSKKKKMVRGLFIALVLLLLVNAGGCLAFDSLPKNIF